MTTPGIRPRPIRRTSSRPIRAWGGLSVLLLVNLSTCAHQDREPASASAVPTTTSQAVATLEGAPASAAPRHTAAPATSGSSHDGWPGATAVPPPIDRARREPDSKRQGAKGQSSGVGQAPAAKKQEAEIRSAPAESSSAAGWEMGDEAIGTVEALAKTVAQLNLAFSGLSHALELSEPDCATAERFRRSVCDLASRICVLEGSLPSSAELWRCKDGKQRCAEASERYRAACDELEH